MEEIEFLLTTIKTTIPVDLFDQAASIDRFYTKSFLLSNSAKENVGYNSCSLATAFYKKLVDRLASALFTKMPTMQSNKEDVLEYLESRESELEDFFKQAARNYILYGAEVAQIKDAQLIHFSYGDAEVVQVYNNEILGLKVKLHKELLAFLAAEDLKLNEESNYYVLYYKDKQFLFNEKESILVELKEEYFQQNFSLNLTIYDPKPFIAYTYDLFTQLEKLYSSYIKTHNQIKTLALYDQSVTAEAKKRIEDNFTAIAVPTKINQVKGIGDLVQFVDNSTVASTLNIQDVQIQKLKNEIIDCVDAQDLFNGALQDNPNETRVAAENRVAVSQINLEDRQKRFNNFVENCCKYLIAQNFNIPVSDVDLELSSVSILKEQQEEMQKQATLESVVALLNQANGVDAIMAELYYQLADEIIKKSPFSDSIKATLEKVKEKQLSMREQIAQQDEQNNLQAQQTNLSLTKLQEEIGKLQDERTKLQAEAAKITAQAQDIPLKTQIEIDEQKQQSLETERLIEKQKLEESKEIEKNFIEKMLGR